MKLAVKRTDLSNANELVGVVIDGRYLLIDDGRYLFIPDEHRSDDLHIIFGAGNGNLQDTLDLFAARAIPVFMGDEITIQLTTMDN